MTTPPQSAIAPYYTWFIVISVITIVLGKIAFANDELLPLYLYGISVTGITLLTFIVAFFYYRDPYLKARELPIQRRKRLRVACLVAVHNDEEIIASCIESLLAQRYTNKEIIVIDDASTDSTVQVLLPYARRGDIRLIRLKKNIGKKGALAVGMARSSAQVFLFTDSDSIIDPEAAGRAVTMFNAYPDLGAISGHVRALNAEETIFTRIQDTWYEGQFSIRKAAESHFGAVTCVSGPLAVFRREAIYNYIPAWINDQFLGNEFKFATDRTLTGFVLGSTSVGTRLQAKYRRSRFIQRGVYEPKEWLVMYSRSCQALTRVPPTFLQMVQQQIRWKKSFCRNIFFTGLFFWKKHITVVTLYYAHVLFVIFGPIIAFRHLVYLPMQGSILSAFLYLGGVIYLGSMFGIAYRAVDERPARWLYRPLMSLLSTFVFSWLIFYSAITIKRMVWLRHK